MKKAIIIIGITLFGIGLLAWRFRSKPAKVQPVVQESQKPVEVPERLQEPLEWPTPASQPLTVQRVASEVASPQIPVEGEMPTETIDVEIEEIEPFENEEVIDVDDNEIDNQWTTHDILEAINSMDTQTDWSEEIALLENLIELREDLTFESEMNAKLGMANPPVLQERFAEMEQQELMIIQELMERPEVRNVFH